MSWSLNVFIAGPSTIHELLPALNSALNINLQKTENSVGNEYTEDKEYFYPSFVDEHGLENDADMNFEDYPYKLNIWVKTGFDPDGAKRKCYEFAREAFSRLRKTGKYHLMMTEDVQEKIECFEPKRD
jgi:hypothetical protein